MNCMIYVHWILFNIFYTNINIKYYGNSNHPKQRLLHFTYVINTFIIDIRF